MNSKEILEDRVEDSFACFDHFVDVNKMILWLLFAVFAGFHRLHYDF